MIKSCSGGPSFLDNLQLTYETMDNKTLADKYIKEAQDRFYETIKDQFNLEKSEYNLECMESNMGRGGYIKAKGTYKDGSELELYYRWGWCSSGGTDCGESKCFSTTSDTVFSIMKNTSCNSITSSQSHDEYICLSPAYDNTTEVRNECLNGSFEKIDGNKKTISIIQSSNRCYSSASVGLLDCIGI
jgi:hypothetical protein